VAQFFAESLDRREKWVRILPAVRNSDFAGDGKSKNKILNF
jgi:hypothetical protein